MARRSDFADFVRNFGLGYNLVNQVGQDVAMGRIASAKAEQSQGFTAEDGKQLEAIANAKDADGKALYSLSANEDGSYTVASTADPSVRGTIAQHGVTDFLGQRTNGAMTDDQVSSARQRAMAGVVSRTNPIAGQQMLNNVMQAERDTQRFGWEQASSERAIRKGNEADADEAATRAADSATSDWLKNRLLNADGSSRAGTVDDHLAASQFRAMKLAEGGRLNESSAVYKDFAAQSAIKIQMETAERDREAGIAASALATGDTKPLVGFWNKYIPDGSHVTDVQRGKDGRLTISRETSDGRTLPPKVMSQAELVSGMAALRDPMALYQFSQNEFKNNLMLREAARADAHSAREQATFNAQAPQRQLASTVATLQLGMGNTDSPTERAAIQGKLSAMTGGVLGAKHEPPTGYRWKNDGTGGLEAIPGGPADKTGPGQKQIPAEVARMNVALRSLDQGLNEYETLLKNFNPRNPKDQFTPKSRAQIESLVADLQLQFKEAQALGALAGPDIELINKSLASPASLQGASFGREGLMAQLGEVRKALERRKSAISQEFNVPVPGASAAPAASAAAPSASAAPASATTSSPQRFTPLWEQKRD
ncbi:hypothetical protein [Roseateles chitosanitabidus]|uniref:hypothetical protein n=1 Tax=Roseateles chitosanitabidus TaxID=65048 RepID=UPI0011DFB820|nr:hypothetical protein [Roseateles chitosanitabidus]